VLGPLIRLRRVNDAAEIDVVADNGTLRVSNATRDTVATWLGASTGRVVRWYNQTAPSASSIVAAGSNIWVGGQTGTSIADQPSFVTCPTFNGYNPPGVPGVLFVKFIKNFELTGDFTVMLWAKMTNATSLQSLFGLGVYQSGILIRTDCTCVLNNFLPNGALTTYFTPDAWNHVAVTRSAGVVAMWVGGVQWTSQAGITGTVNPYTTVMLANVSNCGLFLGCNGHRNEERWAGSIAECMLYDMYMDIGTLELVAPTW
jgi:hypothetical protein